MARDPYPSETQDRFLVRFPEGMRDRIREAAEINNRSMNAEIVARLETTFAEVSGMLDQAAVADIVDKAVKAAASEAAFRALDAMIKAIDGGAMTPEERMRILFPDRPGAGKTGEPS